MAEQQQQRINQAAQQFTEALVESFRAVSERGATAQEQGAQLTQEFFNQVIDKPARSGGGHPSDGPAAGRPAAAGR